MTFSDLAVYFQNLEETASRITMTEILSKLFQKVDSSEIGIICYLLQGRVVPLYEAVEFGIADKLMIRAIAKACDVSLDEVTRQFKKTGDLGESIIKLKTQNFPLRPSNFEGQAKLKITSQKYKVIEIYDRLKNLAEAGGTGSQVQKIEILSELLKTSDSLSAKYIVRITLDKLRLGFSDMTILDALSWYLSGDKSKRLTLEDAYNVRPDIGYIATEVKKAGVNNLKKVRAKIGVPILAALCQRLPSADEMIKKMETVAVEPKYDGVRVQIHYQKVQSSKFKVQSYSRNLENTTDMFPELNEIYKQIKAQSVIFDSEAVGTDPKTGKILPFQETTTRKRKYDIGLFRARVPIRFYVFDILYKDGVDLLSLPLSKRRQILEDTLIDGDILTISPQQLTDKAEKLRNYHNQQLKSGLEGVVVKKWHSAYEPGRRGFSWVKFKEDEGQTGKLTDTIDGVVMGYYSGEGKRSGFGIGAFLIGVKDRENYVSVTKVGTGVSDELWRKLYKRLEILKVLKKPKEYKEVSKTLSPDIWCRPEMVVEVAGDDLTRSPNHTAGFAIRFPRLVRIRDDKGPSDATTINELKSMYENQ